MANRGAEGEDISLSASQRIFDCPGQKRRHVKWRKVQLRNLKVSVACPHCVEGHIILANEMFFGEVPWPSSVTSKKPYSMGYEHVLAF